MAGESESKAEDGKRRASLAQHVLFYTVCALVIGFAVWGTELNWPGVASNDGKDCFYNLLVQGFQAGHLNVKKDPPAELGRLADPYNTAYNGPYVHDVDGMSYYKGKLYLYFGITPVLLLYWPYVELTGYYLTDAVAAFIFCSTGFLAGAGLLFSIWRRSFPKASVWAAMAGIFIFGVAIHAQEIEWAGSSVSEVASSGAFACMMIALAAIWRALQGPENRVLCLLLASLTYGLAIGSRPSLAPGAAILLVPVAQVWRGTRETGLRPRVGSLLAAAVGPITLIGLGLMLYNFLRFGNPLDFGYRYQLTYMDQTAVSRFSLHYFWFDLRYYILEPAQWTGHIPFVHTVSAWATSYGNFDPKPYYGGILFAGFPPVWMALAAAWVCKAKPTDEHFALRWFVAGLFLVFTMGALTLCCFLYAANRYEMDFLPPLMLLAVIGLLGVEHTLPALSQQKNTFRLYAALVLSYSLVVDACASCDAYATASYFTGNVLYNRGLMDEARNRFEKALAFAPQETDAHCGLGNISFKKGDIDGAIAQYQIAVEQRPDFPEGHNNLGHCLLQKGRLDEAIAQFETAVQLRPGSLNYRNGLGSAYAKKGLWNAAIVQFGKSVEMDPSQAEAHNNLGCCFLQAGQIDKAIGQNQIAVSLDPRSATYLDALADALCQKGSYDEAALDYKKVLELRPGDAGARNNFGYCLQQIGRPDEAIVQYLKAIHLQPGIAQTYFNLGNAYREKRMAAQATSCYEKAIELAPQFAAPQLNLAWMLATWPDKAIRNGSQALALAEQINQLSGGQDPEILRVLAAAYAEAGRFPDAITTAHQASSSAAQSKPELFSELQSDIKLYQNRSPCRSTMAF